MEYLMLIWLYNSILCRGEHVKLSVSVPLSQLVEYLRLAIVASVRRTSPEQLKQTFQQWRVHGLRDIMNMVTVL